MLELNSNIRPQMCHAIAGVAYIMCGAIALHKQIEIMRGVLALHKQIKLSNQVYEDIRNNTLVAV